MMASRTSRVASRIALAAMLLLFRLATRDSLLAQSRVASDFEIAQMEKQLTQQRDFLSQLSGRLNLGDLRATRNEQALARAEYQRALEIAEAQRLDARKDSAMERYATATVYAGMAQAKLGNDKRAFELVEEAMRYHGDNARSWNVYASAMTVLGRPRKAAGAGRNAVAIAAQEVARDPSVENKLDLAIYQYALASALIDTGDRAEAERLLLAITSTLESPAFDAMRRSLAKKEAFEVYSVARGTESAYLSLHNRAGLQLALLYENARENEKAIAAYRKVLSLRTDDANALAALARLAPNTNERERFYADALDANPFVLGLIEDYLRHLGTHMPREIDESTTGGKMRRALVQMARGEYRAAVRSFDALLEQFPNNDTLRTLRREADAQLDTGGLADAVAGVKVGRVTGDALRQILNAFAAGALTPEQRVALDAAQLASVARFDPSNETAAAGQTVFESGTIEGVPFRFAEPTAFSGSFAPRTPLRMTYRILGATTTENGDALLLEPLGVGK